MMTSEYENLTDLELRLRMTIIKFLKKKEGFQIEFFETDLENLIYNDFDPLIKNVNILTPTLFQVNNSARIYKDIQENLDFEDVLEFVPPYFYYDYAQLQLQIIQG